MLILINHFFPDLLFISSDGGIDDWEPALRLARTFDSNANLPDTIDFDASCQPEPMPITELRQELPPPSQFVGSDIEPGRCIDTSGYVRLRRYLRALWASGRLQATSGPTGNFNLQRLRRDLR